MNNDFWTFVPFKNGFWRLSSQIDVYLRSSPVQLWIFKTLSKTPLCVVKSKLMITIRPIKQTEVPAAKRIILSVAYNLFGFEGTLEESIRHFEALGEFNDMDNVQSNYFEAGGMFLVVLNGEQVIGSGALRRLDGKTAELKRMWLLESYHGQGIGYRLITQLIDFARINGYARVRLQTSPQQVRALSFYREVGFYEIPCYNEDVGEISMEMYLP
jgi:putative acetyltransferase